MKRTTIYLPDDLKQAIEARAKERGTTEAEVVRMALAKDLLTPRKTTKNMSFGLFDSGHTDTSERFEELLGELGFGES